MSARGRHHQLRSQLQATIDRIGTIPEAELETRSEYVRYLIVRLSGFVEYGLEQVMIEFIQANSYGPVRSYALAYAGYLGNPNADNICKFVRRLDGTWAKDLDAFLATEERRQSLNSLIGLRHQVAHGMPSASSFGTLMGYVAVVDELFDWLLDRLEPLMAN
jgi:hypothetical protein